MEERALGIKAAIAAACGALTILWGWFGWMVVALLFIMTLDYITGWRKARNTDTWKSSIAKKGIDKKAGMLAIVCGACVMDWVIGTILTNIPMLKDLPFTYSVLIGPMIVSWYFFSEFGSVLENCKQLGTKEIPFLSKIIKVLTKSIEKVGDKISPE